MFAHACGVGLESVVSKIRDSRYVSGRGNDWVKKTCAQARDAADRRLPVEGKQIRRHLYRRMKGNSLAYAGKVDHGFDKSSAAELQARLKPLVRKTQPYARRIGYKGEDGGSWPAGSADRYGCRLRPSLCEPPPNIR